MNLEFVKKKALKYYKTGDTIFKEDDPGRSMYVIQSGEVEVSTTVNSQKTVLANLGKGSIFGEMSLVDSQPRSATVKALTNVVCLEITDVRFQQLLGEVPGWMQTFYRILVERLRVADQKQRELPNEVVARQIIYLLYLQLALVQKKAERELSISWEEAVNLSEFLLQIDSAFIRKVMSRLILTDIAESVVDFQLGRQFVVKDMSLFTEFAQFCQQDGSSDLPAEQPQEFSIGEVQLMNLIRRILDDQIKATDITVSLLNDKCIAEYGKELEVFSKEIKRLKKEGILKSCQDEKQYKYFDVNRKKFNQKMSRIERLEFFRQIVKSFR